MLDEFNDGSKAAPGGAAPAEALDEDWARMLQEGMADLLNDADESVCLPVSPTEAPALTATPSPRCRDSLKSWPRSSTRL